MDDLVLNTIFGSSDRVKIIRYFLLRENEKVDIEKVRQFLKISKKANFKKEVRLFAKSGFLKIVGKKVLLNPFFPLNDDLRRLIIFPSFWYKEKIADLFRKSGSIKLLIFSGILANEDKSVEVEILIVGNRLNEKKIEKLISQIEADLGTEINYLILNEKDFYYRFSMFDRLVRGILDGKHEILVSKIDIGKLG